MEFHNVQFWYLLVVPIYINCLITASDTTLTIMYVDDINIFTEGKNMKWKSR